MSDTTTTTKTRTITLTDRPPVRITEADWPIIASGDERPGHTHNGTPVPDYETDRYTIRVRQHADGRALVYGVIDAATAWTGTEDWRGGELLSHPYSSGADNTQPDSPVVRTQGRRVSTHEIAGAIRRVGESGGIIESVIRECIAGLPAETI